MAQTYIHYGPYNTILSNTSPGLLFLSRFLPVLDSLDPAISPLLRTLLARDAKFIINSGPPIGADQVISMLAMRPVHLSKFGHDVHVAWDIAKPDGTRTVMYESTSITVFKEDADEVGAGVKEFNVVELAPVAQGEEVGIAGFIAVELRTYMDTTPVQERSKALRDGGRA